MTQYWIQIGEKHPRQRLGQTGTFHPGLADDFIRFVGAD